MLLYVCFQGFLCYTSSPCDTAAGHINDEQFVDVRVYWGSRAEYCFIPEVFCPSAPSSVKLSFLPQSLFQFPSKVSSFFFFLCSCTQRCLPVSCDGENYLSHCPAVWVVEATRGLHGNPVQGSVYCRCTVPRCKNAINCGVVTRLLSESRVFMLCCFLFVLNIFKCLSTYLPCFYSLCGFAFIALNFMH